jgi:formylglycine-generating enzyme required for sulfatase activity/serine/threonine protein kinase
LHAFGLGKLDAASAAVVRQHLETCPDCRYEAAILTLDSSLEQESQSDLPGSSSAPGLVSVSSSLPAPVAGAPSPPPTPFVPPELAAHTQYQVLRELGRGGMGVVYLARHQIMDRLEVLKVVNRALLDRPGARERFLQEIRSAARLSHPNVVTAYSALQLGQLLAFAMEYVEGQTLLEVVKAHGRLPVALACFYAYQTALGLQHAFDNGMIHRDINPRNLILSCKGPRPIVKILDFGLAKITQEKDADVGLTAEGQMLGTPEFIAPEQMLDAARVDIRADLYSLGCTLYFLLTARPPFQGNNRFQVQHAHLFQQARPVNEERPEVPPELAAVVAKLMAKEPAQRYQQPTEVAEALLPFIKPGAPRPSPGPVKEAKPGPPTLPRAKSRKWLTAAWVVTCLTLLTFLGILASDLLNRTPKNGGEAAPQDSGQQAVAGNRDKATPPAPLPKEDHPAAPAKGPDTDVGKTKGPPPLTAKAPFDRAQARELQQAWAKFLGKKVEETLDLGGGVTMDVVLIPPGSFVIGSPVEEVDREANEVPHSVKLTRPFYVSKYPVTQAQYEIVMGQNPSWLSSAGVRREEVRELDTRDFPVENVSWHDADAYCHKLVERTGWKANLPTEAQWEYACRAGTTTPFSFGTELNGTQANCDGTNPYGTPEKGPNQKRPCTVHSYAANAFGLYGMHGNVSQWCRDWYGEYEPDKPTDPEGPDVGTRRVMRGGSWFSVAKNCRAARRTDFPPDYRCNDVGFRVAFSVD